MGLPTMKDLLESGVHFGHQTRKWNPKMKPYIFQERNGIYIIDLLKTLNHVKAAHEKIKEVARGGGEFLFVGTKKQASKSIQEAAERCGMHYVAHRWLGGMLTNFQTVKKSVAKLKRIERMEVDGTFDTLPKKERLLLLKEKDRLNKNLSGLKDMEGLPKMIFIIDPVQEAIAVNEAHKMKIPIVGVVDTNCNPDLIDIPIPGNDDAIRAISLFTNVVADAILEGQNEAGKESMTEEEEEELTEERPTEKGERAKPTPKPEAAKPTPKPEAAKPTPKPEAQPEPKVDTSKDTTPSNNEEKNDMGTGPSMDLIKELRNRTGIGIMDCKKALAEANNDMEQAIRVLKEKGAIKAAKKSDREIKEGILGICVSDDKKTGVLVEVGCETDFVAKNEDFITLANNIAAHVAESELASDKDALMAQTFTKGDGTVGDAITAAIQKIGENIVIGNFHKITHTGAGFLGQYLHFNKKLAVLLEVGLSSDDAAQKEEITKLANDICLHITSDAPIATSKNDVDAKALEEQKEIFTKQAKESGKPENVIEKMIEGKVSKWLQEVCLLEQKYFTGDRGTIKEMVAEVAKATGVEITLGSFVRAQVGA